MEVVLVEVLVVLLMEVLVLTLGYRAADGGIINLQLHVPRFTPTGHQQV